MEGTVEQVRSTLAAAVDGAKTAGRKASSGIRTAIDGLERKIATLRGGDGIR